MKKGQKQEPNPNSEGEAALKALLESGELAVPSSLLHGFGKPMPPQGKPVTAVGLPKLPTMDAQTLASFLHTSERLRQQVTKTLEIAWPDAYAVYRKLKYAHGKHPTVQSRKTAYAFAWRALIHLSYNLG